MKGAEFSCGRLGFGMEKYIKQNTTEKNTENIKKEVAVLKRLCHPSVLRLLDTVGEGKRLYIVMNELPRGTLTGLLTGAWNISWWRYPVTLQALTSSVTSQFLGVNTALDLAVTSGPTERSVWTVQETGLTEIVVQLLDEPEDAPLLRVRRVEERTTLGGVEYARLQFPILPAFAMTIHRGVCAASRQLPPAAASRG